MSIQQIITFLEFCLKTYFLFQSKYYEQVNGVVIGSPISPIVANFIMEEFETMALSTASTYQDYSLGIWTTLTSI